MQIGTDEIQVQGQLSPSLSTGDVGVIALVPEKWDSVWQTRQHLLSRLSRYFKIVWCNPAYTKSDLWCRSNYPNLGVADPNSGPFPGLTVYQPERWLPDIGGARFLGRRTMEARLRRAQRILFDQGCRRIVLYLWRPEYAPALDAINHAVSCYHIDDEYTFSTVERPLDAEEGRLITRADQVFISSPGLLEKKGQLNPNTAFLPNGVDYDAYLNQYSEPADLRPIPHPRIGYVGFIKENTDLDLLIALADRHLQWSFVLVGPYRNQMEHSPLIKKLSRIKNVHFLGNKPVRALPAYNQHMDVGMLCYKVNGYTKFIYPLKLHEYLASGRPCVGPPIRSLEEFSHVIHLARTTDEWSYALTKALSPEANTSTEVTLRRGVARQYDWNKLAWVIADALSTRLNLGGLERFEKFSPDVAFHK